MTRGGRLLAALSCLLLCMGCEKATIRNSVCTDTGDTAVPNLLVVLDTYETWEPEARSTLREKVSAALERTGTKHSVFVVDAVQLNLASKLDALIEREHFSHMLSFVQYGEVRSADDASQLKSDSFILKLSEYHSPEALWNMDVEVRRDGLGGAKHTRLAAKLVDAAFEDLRRCGWLSHGTD